MEMIGSGEAYGYQGMFRMPSKLTTSADDGIPYILINTATAIYEILIWSICNTWLVFIIKGGFVM